ncbi:Cystathionine gamma-synthase [Polyrhizophydium stewartii]|uniref:Cystathionine gamma-synthase n=1 Tax=Polyrhizophydium stewartii TaxID=2732419 RepID=A0ABR4N5X6_9FUNG
MSLASAASATAARGATECATNPARTGPCGPAGGGLTKLGAPVPLNTPHAVSVALPTWSDNVGYEEGDPRVVKAMQGGYPRFVFNPLVKKLMAVCCERFAADDEDCLVFSAREHAQACRIFMRSRLAAEGADAAAPRIRIVELLVMPESHIHRPPDELPSSVLSVVDSSITHPIVHVLLFPLSLSKLAKQFWQHTGEGVSSRFAEHVLRSLEIAVDSLDKASKGRRGSIGSSSGRSRFSHGPYGSLVQKHFLAQLQGAATEHEIQTFVEQRFGRNLDLSLAAHAKIALRRRIAGLLGDATQLSSLQDSPDQGSGSDPEDDAIGSAPSRGVSALSAEDVFLFPCGMSAIYNVHRAILGLRPGIKSVQFGFPYTDTLKIQEKFGPGCHFLGFGGERDLQLLDDLLKSEPISAIFCEFPSNPLLQSPDLARLSQIARHHDCILVVDETIGNFVNTNVLTHADVVVSSLTKVFSGDSNVMGGSAVLNPQSPKYERLRASLQSVYIDTLWCEDALFLERNSRSFVHRAKVINRNAEALCDFLNTHPKVETLHFPKFTDSQTYLKYVRSQAEPGYGGLFSIVLSSDDAAMRFYDALSIYKGPSLGTNFTLACPYTILAHYTELDWAASFGVPRRLIRVSVGVEDSDELLRIFREALEIA